MNETSFMNQKRDRLIRIKPALILMRDASSYAERAGQEAWQFAIELDELQNQGLTTTDLRWLILSQTVVHAIETTLASDSKRTFKAPNSLSFVDRSVFILSERGLATIGNENPHVNSATDLGAPHSNYRNIPKTTNQSMNKQVSTNTNSTPTLMQESAPAQAAASTNENRDSTRESTFATAELPKPKWNSDTRELSFNGKAVKRFKWPAVNQELLLVAFEELNWPDQISDPLPPSANVDSKSRLHDTIKCLNRHLKDAPFRFHGNGNGKGAIWRLKKVD